MFILVWSLRGRPGHGPREGAASTEGRMLRAEVTRRAGPRVGGAAAGAGLEDLWGPAFVSELR